MGTGLRSARLVTLGRLTLIGADGAEDRELATRKRKLALLAVLALSKQPLTRDALVEMFWGEQPEERARHSLSDALSHLRRVLGPDAITQRRSEVGLCDTLSFTIDVQELHAAARGGRWSEVVALYGGEFMDAIHLSGSTRLEQWVDGERRRASGLFATGAKAECDRLFRVGEHESCYLLARKWLDESPSSPHAATFALRALAGDGSPEGAQRALHEYARVTRILQDELGARPDVMVAALAQEIADGLAARQSDSVIVTAMPAPRAEELDDTRREESSSVPPPVDPIPVAPAPVAPAVARASRRGRWPRRAMLTATAGALVALVWSARATSTPPQDARREPPVLSPSAEATALYRRAVDGYERDANRQRAIALLDSAIRLDSTFAMAYRYLWNVISAGNEDRHRSNLMLTKAAEYADRLPRRERLLTLGAYHSRVSHDYARAAGFYRELLVETPDDPGAWANLGVVYDLIGDRRRSVEAYTRALALDPKRINTLMNLADARYELGDRAGARRALDSMAVRYPGHPSLFMRSAQVAHADGDSARVEMELRALLAATPGDDFLQSAGNLLLAKALWAYGRLDEGDAARATGMAHDRARGSGEGVLTGALEMAHVDLWARGDTARARRRLREALRNDPVDSLAVSNRPYLPLVTILALTGAVEDARRRWTEYEGVVPIEDRRGNVAAERRTLGVLLVSEGRVAEGVRTLASAWDPMCRPCGLPELGWGYERAAMPDSARAVYQRYAELRSTRKFDLTDGFHRVRIARWLRRRSSTSEGDVAAVRTNVP